ncbi:hypothetical protein JL722_2013 [Aureococcus anophagefferens]|nr:hypothetical protein JL722_2013 [Aureococcus anophagefferens]
MSGAPPKKKPFAFTSGPGGAPLPPPAAAAPVLPSAQRAGSQRARCCRTRSCSRRGRRRPRSRRSRRRRRWREAAAAPVAVEREALGATKEAAAAAVARAAAAAPGGDAPRETEDEARCAREAVAARSRRMPGFYGGDARREASDIARGRCAAEGPRLGDRLLETLRPHQVEGVSWVCARLWQNQGCVLADEMGLGKTATVLASLGVLMGVDGAAALETERSFRAVIACPAGVAHTWLAEAKKWLRPTERCAARAQAGGSPHCCFFADADAAELRAFKRRKRVARAVDARERKKYGDAARDDWDADPDDAVARFARAPLSSKPVLRALFAARATKAQGLRALTAAKHLCSSVRALDAALDDGGDTVGNSPRRSTRARPRGAAGLGLRASTARRRSTRRDAAAALNDADGGVFLLLLALKAGGVGLTLTGASRLILFEPSWNPADDDQAAARVWRDGQTRPTFIYTLATAHSLEEHVLKRQAAKRNLAGRVRHAQREVALLDLAEMEARFDADRDARDDLATLLALGTSSPDAPCALFAPGGPPEYRGDAPLAAAAAAAVQVDHLPDRFAPA